MIGIKFTLLCCLSIIFSVYAPPVNKSPSNNKGDSVNDEKEAKDILDDLEYARYLKEVVEILENDPKFKSMIDNATVDDIKSGNIAQHLSLVEHNVRTALDEAKQREIVRLRKLVAQKVRLLNDVHRRGGLRGTPNDHMKNIVPQHIDHHNLETFGVLDLEKLIRRASLDLDEIDKQREKEFKDYELRKEYDRREQLSHLSPEEQQKLEHQYQETLEKKKKHPKVNHPGSVDQMEEVWENVDHLEPEQFNPKTFFSLHDTNTDGFLDENEIEAIMLKEAEKIHNNATEVDAVEKQEELDRMREHVMREFDKNNDRMLSYQEFMSGINGTGAKNEQGWESIEDKPVYSDQEFQQFSDKMAHQSTPLPMHQQSQQHIERQQEHQAQQNPVPNNIPSPVNNQGYPGHQQQAQQNPVPNNIPLSVNNQGQQQQAQQNSAPNNIPSPVNNQGHPEQQHQAIHT
ncbi:unnamed protein product [Didymodactylos carnosus]|uniref:EF-hand domain-containing protein n=1 Tax=Didymodactylos carnosus TaxID=1234261 RepID=A0A813PZ41_9BILA|nr:unnamed protein product [Didymodactylos carnosus]CAF1187423.1 unnamed protein product [Didymodactylos carnosus]CAF3538315.1 unnamed protein product [Didymodactylos carnosus]CAF3998442.1 unnamed protein product [Didymodactylos carnosus]